MALEMLVANLSGSHRYETLEGDKHIVTPCAALAEGVIPGSAGAYFYASNVIGKRPHRWNGRPVVVQHPEINGKQASACDPIIFNSRRVGWLFNTSFDSKLRPEVWIDINKCNKVDDRIVAAIERGEAIEASTGIEVFANKKEGEFGGKKYKGEITHIDPDHLAILPDKTGAYSIADGGGLNVTNQLRPAVNHTVIANELSFLTIQQKLQLALRDKVGKPGVEWWGYVTDVYETFFIYYSNGKNWMLSYRVKDDEVKLTGEPEEVIRYNEWRTPDGTFVGNNNPEVKETQMADRKSQVTSIIVANIGYDEGDREFLEKQPDKEFAKTLSVAEKAKVNAATSVNNTTTTPPAPTPPAPPAAPPATPPITAQQMSPEQMVQTILNSNTPTGNYLKQMVEAGEMVTNQLVEQIIACPRNVFTKEQLKAKTPGELQAIAVLAGVGVGTVVTNQTPGFNPALFLGNAGGAAGQNPATQQHAEKPLVVKRPDYSKAGMAANKNAN